MEFFRRSKKKVFFADSSTGSGSKQENVHQRGCRRFGGRGDAVPVSKREVSGSILAVCSFIILGFRSFIVKWCNTLRAL